MTTATTTQNGLSETLKGMNIAGIAAVIRSDWGAKVNYAAKPDLEAMESLDKITDDYICDSGVSVVLYFLCNANSWRGEVAKAVKKELNARCKAQ